MVQRSIELPSEKGWGGNELISLTVSIVSEREEERGRERKEKEQRDIYKRGRERREREREKVFGGNEKFFKIFWKVSVSSITNIYIN